MITYDELDENYSAYNWPGKEKALAIVVFIGQQLPEGPSAAGHDPKAECREMYKMIRDKGFAGWQRHYSRMTAILGQIENPSKGIAVSKNADKFRAMFGGE